MKKTFLTLIMAFCIAVFTTNVSADGDTPINGRNCDPQNPPPEGCTGGFAATQPDLPIFTKILFWEIGKILIFR